MRARRFDWLGAGQVAADVRAWTSWSVGPQEVAEIEEQVVREGDDAVLRLTAEHDATETAPRALRVDAEETGKALAGLDAGLREAMEVAAANIRAVAAAQVETGPTTVRLPQGHAVKIRELAVDAAGLYAPGGRAAYPSSVLMCAIPAREAGVRRLVLASPPGPDGNLDPATLAAAELCAVDEVYAMGGAQAIFALAHGTESVAPVDVIAGPGNSWVQEAKRSVYGRVGVDSYAGPSELMLIAGHDTDPEWAARDLCAQAEHGVDSPLLVAAVEEAVLEQVARAAEGLAAERPSVADARLALIQVPDTGSAIDLANAFAPEHLQLMEEDATLLAAAVTTAGCVFAGRHGATAFGDYAAGSTHVLPTGGAGRFAGPLGPGVFRRRVATVEIPADAAEKLAPHVDAIARAEGFPVHGESAMIRSESDE
jgi:histidinol dehydrogenase